MKYRPVYDMLHQISCFNSVRRKNLYNSLSHWSISMLSECFKISEYIILNEYDWKHCLAWKVHWFSVKVYLLRANYEISVFWWKSFSAKLNRLIKFLDFTNVYDKPKDSSLLIKTPGPLFPVRRVWNNLTDMTNEWSLCCHILYNLCIPGFLFIYSNDICLTIHAWPFSDLNAYWVPVPEMVSSSAKNKKSDTSCVPLS